LTKVTADIAQVAAAWVKVTTAKNLPQTFDVEGLGAFVDDAVKKRLPAIQAALQKSDGCH